MRGRQGSALPVLEGSKVKIRPMQEEDADRVLAIYAEGIEDGLATFEARCPGWLVLTALDGGSKPPQAGDADEPLA